MGVLYRAMCGGMWADVFQFSAVHLTNESETWTSSPLKKKKNLHVKDLQAYGDVLPKWVTFSPKILRHGFHFRPKKKKGLSHRLLPKKLSATLFFFFFFFF